MGHYRSAVHKLLSNLIVAVVDWRKDTGTGREDAPFRDEPKAGMAISDDSG